MRMLFKTAIAAGIAVFGYLIYPELYFYFLIFRQTQVDTSLDIPFNEMSSPDGAGQFSHYYERASYVWSSRLKATVEQISKPRHYLLQPDENARVRELIKAEMEEIGLETSLQGTYNNVLGLSENWKKKPWVLVCAHYDSVAESPGANDNASGVAVMLEIGRIICKEFNQVPIALVAFNAEEIADPLLPEDEQFDLLGSTEFFAAVKNGTLPIGPIDHVYILDMVGLVGDEQTSPEGLPPFTNAPGNYIGILCDNESAEIGRTLLHAASLFTVTQNKRFSAQVLTVPRVATKFIPDISRSAHASAWINNIPATLVTDTGNFRNPNSLQELDFPESLNYEFMAFVAKAHIATIADSTYTPLGVGSGRYLGPGGSEVMTPQERPLFAPKEKPKLESWWGKKRREEDEKRKRVEKENSIKRVQPTP